MVRFFKKRNIIYDFQYGFREKHSLIHALLDATSLGYDAIQDKKYSALLLMDFRKAFDTVPHKTLLQKLYHYGIRGLAYFLESYLTNREQFVSINNNNSLHKPINIGVPQGSILGPLFYIVYVNDIYIASSCKPRLFADDTCLFLCSPTLSDLQQKNVI